MESLRYIGFDADDTLWHNETVFRDAQEKFRKLLSRYHSPDWIDQRLYRTEMRNLKYFGYGVKGFTLSMIETAIELTEGRIKGVEIQQIIDHARDMLREPIQLLDHVQSTLECLSRSHELILISKGDLFDQETKLVKSGLGDYFSSVEIVSEKTAQTYQRILESHQIRPAQFLMVGNSLKSDVLPVLEIGGQAVHVPYQVTWEHEWVAAEQIEGKEFLELEHIGLLRELLAE